MRKCRHIFGQRAQLSHQAIDDAAGRATTEQVGQRRVLPCRRVQCRPVQGRSRGLMATEKGGAHLYGAGAQRQCGADTCTIDNTAGGDDRQPHRLYYLWQQAKGAPLQAEIALEEMAAMATGLQPWAMMASAP